jgi:uncharacterized protein YcfL
MDEYYKQIAASVLFNPGVGVISSNANIFQNLICSSKPVLLVGHEIVELLYASNAGNILDLGSLSILIQRAVPSQQIDDSQSVVLGANASRVSNLQFNFFYGNTYISYTPVVRPINLILQPNQQVTISYAVRYNSPVALATDSVQFTYRLYWRELE